MKRLSVTRRAQGMIETIVALSVLITAIVSLMSMVVSAANARNANEYATVAANLAREGVEVVVAQRNDNWINDRAFDFGMYTGTDYTYGFTLSPASGAWTGYSDPNLVGDPSAKIYKYVSPSPYLGLMVQAASQPAQTASTPYSRLVTMDAICDDESYAISNSVCPGIKIGVRVTSTVQWLDRGQSHRISAIETIYDWR
jgi:hypothetical protein